MSDDGIPDPKKARIEDEDVPVGNTWMKLLSETRCDEIADSTHTKYIAANSDLHTALNLMDTTNSSVLAVYDKNQDAYIGFLSCLDVAVTLVQSLRDSDLDPASFGDMATLCRDLSKLDHSQVMSVYNIGKRTPFQHIEGEMPLIEAIRIMVRLHCRTIVVNPVSPKEPEYELGSMLTQKAVVKFVHQHLADMPALSRFTVGEMLRLRPSLRQVMCVQSSDSALSAFELMTKWRISGIPVLEDDCVVGCLSINDVVTVISKPRDLMLLFEPSSELLKVIRKKSEVLVTPVVTATVDDSFGIVVTKLVDNDVHRAIVVDDEEHVIGIITLGTVLEMLLVK